MSTSSEQSTGNTKPTQDELEDIILSARYGELEEIQEFVKKFGIAPLAESRDDRGNGCLHMAAANGHKDIISFLIPLVSSEALSATNQSGNTPLHWAAMNGHIDTLRLLVPALPKDALFLKNQFGRDALSEAENAVPEGEQDAASPQQECVGYLLTFMELEKEKEGKDDEDEEEEATAEEGGEGGTSSESKAGEPTVPAAKESNSAQDSRQ